MLRYLGKKRYNGLGKTHSGSRSSQLKALSIGTWTGSKTELGLEKTTGNANNGLLLVINNLAVYTGGIPQLNMHSPSEARQDMQ